MKEINEKGERQLQSGEHVPVGPVRIQGPRGPDPKTDLGHRIKVLEDLAVLLQKAVDQTCEQLQKHEEQIASLQKSMPRGIPKP